MKAHRRDFIKAASVLAGTGAVERFVSAQGTAPVEAVEQPTDRLGDIEAFAFDAYGTLFDVFSVTALCEDLFPGAGQGLAQLWRAKQLQYSLLRSPSWAAIRTSGPLLRTLSFTRPRVSVWISPRPSAIG